MKSVLMRGFARSQIIDTQCLVVCGATIGTSLEGLVLIAISNGSLILIGPIPNAVGRDSVDVFWTEN